MFPADSDRDAVRIELFDDEIEQLSVFDPLTGEILRTMPRTTIYPKTHYVTPRDTLVVLTNADVPGVIGHVGTVLGNAKINIGEYHQARMTQGGDALAARAEGKLGVKMGNTTADGRVTLEPIYCLGLCSVSPSAMLDGKIFGRLDDKKLDALIAQADR